MSATGQLCLAGGIVLQPGGTSWSTTNQRPQIQRQADGELRLGAGADSGSSAAEGSITFHTSASGYGGTLAEKLRINSSGTVRIKRAVSTSLGNDSIFLAIGDTENGTNVNRMIGFGYNSNFGTSVYPASMGYTESDNSGNTKGALTFNTRNTTGATDVPVERLRITSGGNVRVTSGLIENSNTISSNYTVSTNFNAMSAGPMTISDGVSVTVPSGSAWTIV